MPHPIILGSKAKSYAPTQLIFIFLLAAHLSCMPGGLKRAGTGGVAAVSWWVGVVLDTWWLGGRGTGLTPSRVLQYSDTSEE